MKNSLKSACLMSFFDMLRTLLNRAAQALSQSFVRVSETATDLADVRLSC